MIKKDYSGMTYFNDEDLKEYKKANYWRGFMVAAIIGVIMFVIVTEVYLKVILTLSK